MEAAMPTTDKALRDKIMHAEVVGSLQRPPALVAARSRMRDGTLPHDQYQIGEDGAVDAAIALQEEAGLEILTDGEMRRDFFFDFFVSSMSGLSPVPATAVSFHNHEDVVQEIVFPFSVTEKVKA